MGGFIQKNNITIGTQLRKWNFSNYLSITNSSNTNGNNRVGINLIDLEGDVKAVYNLPACDADFILNYRGWRTGIPTSGESNGDSETDNIINIPNNGGFPIPNDPGTGGGIGEDPGIGEEPGIPGGGGAQGF